jgi:hypothetical protein
VAQVCHQSFLDGLLVRGSYHFFICPVTRICLIVTFFYFNGSTAPWGPRPPHFSRLHNDTFRHTTLGRTPLDEGPARRRDLYLTTHNTHKRQISML